MMPNGRDVGGDARHAGRSERKGKRAEYEELEKSEDKRPVEDARSNHCNAS